MVATPILPIATVPLAGQEDITVAPVSVAAGTGNFSRLLVQGLDQVNTDQITADKLVHDFALSDAVPVHQVTYALEQAKLSLSLMTQVRNRLVEAYQQMMNMQL